MEIQQIFSILESAEKLEKLSQEKINYKINDLDPILSEKSVDYHYNILAKSYVDRFNNNEGDMEFNRAGAILHNILFSQFKSPGIQNNPYGITKELIIRKYESYDKFKDQFLEIAMGIQGSGWVYLSFDGEIKTIKNHQLKKDILLLIDWWEHAFFTDYGPDKKKYLKNIWKIIDWEIINQRLLINYNGPEKQ
jgi:superoxide dismutase, Fe-Mn family